MRCSILEDRVAVWTLKNTNLRLSALAADILVEQRKLHWRQLRLIRHYDWNDFEGPGEPLTGGATAILGSLTAVATGIGSVPFRLAKSAKRRERHEAKKRRKKQQREARRSGSGSGTLANRATGTAVIDQAKKSNTKANGTATNGTTKELPNGSAEIPAEKAPATKDDRATNGPDMGKHTSIGSPISKSKSHNDNDTDGGDSVMSADPDQNAAEDVVEDVTAGLGKSGEAILKGS